MTHILSGEPIARRILNGLKKKTGRRILSLVVVQVGANPVSEKYIREKEKAAALLGVGFKVVQLPANVSEAELEKTIATLAKDPKVSGMIVQLPLPSHLQQREILDCIPLKKDVDVLSSKALGLFAQGALPWMPPTVQAISLFLKESNTKLNGTNVAVIGAGRLVGLPLSLWLMRQGATLSILNKETKNLASFTRKADVVISGVGKQRLVKGNMIKKGAVVIDAGTSVEQGKTKGDVDFDTVSKQAKFISPVPGGVGPLTVACLFQNLTKLSNYDM